ncbi:MAG TPA: hypothetical protein VK391_03960 [Allosphingosinicella sp.]|nr:hypothetical protein [Allosphingosinicella sp.]
MNATTLKTISTRPSAGTLTLAFGRTNMSQAPSTAGSPTLSDHELRRIVAGMIG